MKQFRFLFPFVIFLVILTFTSCLENDNNPQSAVLYGIVTVKSNLGIPVLKTDNGVTYNVVKNSFNKDMSDMKKAIVVFSFINEDDLYSDKKSFDIELKNAVSITRDVVYTTRGSSIDSLKAKCYDPILNFDKMVSDGDSITVGDGILTAKINYLFSEKIHNFMLFRYAEDGIRTSVNGPDTIDMYLGHVAKGDKGIYEMSRYVNNLDYWPYYFHAFYVEGMVPGGYQKDAVIMRINYRKEIKVAPRDTVNAVTLVKYPTK